MMLMAPVLRGLASTLTVLIAIAVTNKWGDNAGKLAAAVMGAALIVSIEWFAQWSPKRLPWARALLDPRDTWTGVWVQDVKTVTDCAGRHPDDPNVCSVLRVGYQRGQGYWIQGNAYSADGAEIAAYKSHGLPTFTRDGRTMSYVWEGDVVVGDAGPATSARSGLATASLDEGEKNIGDGRVQHVGMNRELVVRLERVTDEYLRRFGFERYTPDSLRTKQNRLGFGAELARALGSAAGSARPPRSGD